MNRQRVGSLLGCGLVLAALVFAQIPSPVRAQNYPDRNLKLGDYGVDVLMLQRILNRDPATRVSGAGPGSPGNETLNFGSLTRSAVVRFQEKYALEVLAPVGLSRGTGFVGPSTRTKLANIAAAPVTQAPISPAPAPAAPPVPRPGATITDITPEVPARPAPIPLADVGPTTTNPNLINLDFFVEEVLKLQEERGASKQEIARMADEIRKTATAQDDFREEFVRNEVEAQTRELRSRGFLKDSLAARLFKSAVNPKKALAQGPGLGGPITYVWTYCTCSGSSAVLYLGPPSTVTLADYTYGTQAYLNYNLPYARFAVGLYTPGAGNTCWFYAGFSCVVVPSYGMMSSVVGTSV